MKLYVSMRLHLKQSLHILITLLNSGSTKQFNLSKYPFLPSQNICQQKVLCRTLVAKCRVGPNRRFASGKLGDTRQGVFLTLIMSCTCHLGPLAHTVSFGAPEATPRGGAASLSPWARLSARGPRRALESAAWRTAGGRDDPRRRGGSGPPLPAAPVGPRPGPSGAVVGRASLAGCGGSRRAAHRVQRDLVRHAPASPAS